MGWWALVREEFIRGMRYYKDKYGLEPLIVFANHKHKFLEQGGWDFPDDIEVHLIPLPENHYIIANAVEDFDATKERRGINETVPSVSRTWGEEG